jgi:RND superfamily putative drug exporter
MASDDRHSALVHVLLAGDVAEAAENVEPLLDLLQQRPRDGDFATLIAGDGSIDREFNRISERDVTRGEMIGIPAALVILLLVFGAGVAAGVPIVLAVAAIAVAMGTTALIGHTYNLNFLVLNIITMIGLAVGIDYSLFIVQRYREERRNGLDKHEAIGRAGATASRAVFFSGGTVVVALLGLLLVPSNVYRSMAIGAVAVAVFAVLAALTLLPAVLSLLGDRLDALRVPFINGGASSEAGGFWSRVASVVMAHPVLSFTVATALLVAASLPYATISLGLSGVTTLPAGSEARHAFETLEREFAGGLIAPAEIAVDGDADDPAVQAAIARLRDAIAGDNAFAGTSVETNEAGDLALVSAVLAGDPKSEAAHDAIGRLRDEYIPASFAGVDARVYVTGSTATEEDVIGVIRTYTPFVFIFVLALSFVLLLVVFRSIVVPAKALIMNLLSVGAAYGLLVLVFQHGVGNELFGFQQQESIEAWLPLFLFSLLFGLSMDYHVFLLSRIREHFDETGDNRAAVAHGLRSTAALITGAALIMVAVFSGFAMGELSPLQQAGFGLAVAVILDATVIRSVVVPASMVLLGDLNWYLPRWLEWLPQIRIDGARAARTGGQRRLAPQYVDE